MVIQLRTPEVPARRRERYRAYVLGTALAVGLIVVSFAAYAWFVSSRQPTALDEAETEKVVSNVGLLMLLPSDEQPTVASVTNLESLAGQPFFRNAKIGDIVLMYPKSGRAILYSPDENMIIEVAPMVLGAQ